MREITLPIKHEDLYMHRDNYNYINYIYMLNDNIIYNTWCSKQPEEVYVLPRIDFDKEKDKSLFFTDLKTAKQRLTEELSQDEKVKQSQLKNRKLIIDAMAKGKIQIAKNALNFNSTQDGTINIVVTGNASIRFNRDAFGNTKGNINFILPNGMGLYAVMEFGYDCGLSGYEQWFVIAPKFIESKIEGYHNLSITPINEISYSNSDMSLTVDQTQFYNRKTFRIEDAETINVED